MSKRDDEIKIHCSSALKNDLFRLAELDGRSLSDYLRYWLDLHVYGHRKKILGQTRGADRESSGNSAPVRAIK